MPANATERRAIVMVWDGLRPDMVTPERTPVLDALAREGVRFTDSHAVFPTVTRCNSSSIATGALPASHGIPGNRFLLRDGATAEVLTAADHTHLERLRARRDGRVLLQPTLAERIAGAGGSAVILGTGSPGAALLQYPQVLECGGQLLNHALWHGSSREAVEVLCGPMPAGALPNSEQNAYFTRIITDYVLPELQPQLTVYWHTDPDRTTHSRGVGHPDSLRGLSDADTNLGAILASLDRLGQRDTIDVIVTSDHGFSTVNGPLPIAQALVDAGVKQSAESADIIVADDTSIYVADGPSHRVPDVVEVLQGLEGVGPIFTGARASLVAPGTAPLTAIGHDGDLTPDILLSSDWTDEINEHGFAGTCLASGAYAAMHGSISPWDIRNTLIASGPSFKRGFASDVPAGNIDIAPTLAHTLGLPDLPLDGRVLAEALAGEPAPETISVHRDVLKATSADGSRLQRVHRSHVGTTTYVDYGEVERA